MSDANVLVQRARWLGRSGDARGALKCYSYVVAQDPSHLEAVHFLGVSFADSDRRFTQARLWIDRSMYLGGDTAIFLTNKSIVLQRANLFDDALVCVEQALRIQPDFPLALLNHGHVLKELKKYSLATHAYEKVVALCPGDLAAYEHLSFCYPYPGELFRRCRVLEYASVLEPNNSDVGFSLGAYCLLAGRFSEGWDYFKYRWTASHVRDDERYSKPPILLQPVFDPQSPRGPVFIWAEQGIGDELMFSSLIYEFGERFGVDIFLQVDPRLYGLVSRSLPGISVVPRGVLPSPELYASQMPAGDLPRLLRRSLGSFGDGSSGFLTPDPLRKRAIRSALPQVAKPIIGISWHSSNGVTRCIPLVKLIDVLRRFDVSLVNLQYGDHTFEIDTVEQQLGRPVFDFAEIDCQNDIEGLVSLISCCDLVVSIGNATVHFAGCLGIQTIALLPHFPGWRWLSHGDKSLWYQSVRLLRQDRPMSWDSVLTSLDGLLASRLNRL